MEVVCDEWVNVCGPPTHCPLYIHPRFITGEECDVLMSLAKRQHGEGRNGIGCRPDDEDLSAEERTVLARFEAKISEATGVTSHASDGRAVFKLCTAETGCHLSDDEDSGQKNVRIPDLPLGLHVDTHNGQHRRFASIILYLNDVEPGSGGETVFPSLRSAGEILLQAGITHTHTAGRHDHDSRESQAAVELLHSARSVCSRTDVDSCTHQAHLLHLGRALGCAKDARCIRPCKGMCLLFYTRHQASGGKVDALSWHGGGRVAAGSQKWILQKFKTVPRLDETCGRPRELNEAMVQSWCSTLSMPITARFMQD